MRLPRGPGISRFRVRRFAAPRNDGVVPPWNPTSQCALLAFGAPAAKGMHMSLGLILVIILIIFLLGGFSGRFGGYGYGMGHSGMGLGGLILVVLLVLLLLGKL
jgi:Protein of unknown function (DUF3309)